MQRFAQAVQLWQRIKTALSWAALLFIFWLAITWSTDYEHLVTGVACVFFLAIIWRRLLLQGRFTLRLIPPLVAYLVLLAVEVFKAGVHVSLIVLDPRLPIAPAFVEVRSPLITPSGKTALANSITLTPGTLSVAVQDRMFLVHMIDRRVPFNLADWNLTRILTELERGGPR